jgi:two-component system, OmpR family, heavy metal sensor histidine kinase CusS
MSWKIAEQGKPSPGRSITVRLIILFTVAAVGILSLSSGILYRGLANSLAERSGHYLRDEVNILRTMLGKPDGLEAVQREIDMETGTLEYVQHYVRVLDKEGQVLIETAGMEQVIPISAFPLPKQKEGRYGEKADWRTADGRTFMLKALCTDLEDTGNRGRLQVALNVTRKEAILVSYRNELFSVGIFGILASLAAAVFVARHGLRPLREITAATQRVSATHLDERLQARQWPRELHELAGSYDGMLDRLQDSFDRLSHCASNMAHELRTPLCNLMGEAEVTLTRERSAAEYRQVLESGLEEYRRLSRIIDSLMFLARADNGVHQLTLDCLDLRAEMDSLAGYYRPMADEKEIVLVVDGTEPANLTADAHLFRRAVGNLITNAIRYTPNRGKVTISWAPGQETETEVSVTDTGCGIAEEELPKLFDRFYRVAAARTSHPQGFGLGLSIVKSIMDLHGGSVAVRSQVDAGTTFTLCFPSPLQPPSV